MNPLQVAFQISENGDTISTLENYFQVRFCHLSTTNIALKKPGDFSVLCTDISSLTIFQFFVMYITICDLNFLVIHNTFDTDFKFFLIHRRLFTLHQTVENNLHQSLLHPSTSPFQT